MIKRKQTIAMLCGLLLTINSSITVHAMTITEMESQIAEETNQLGEMNNNIISLEERIEQKENMLTHIEYLLDKYSVNQIEDYQELIDDITKNYPISEDVISMNSIIKQEQNIKLVTTTQNLDKVPIATTAPILSEAVEATKLNTYQVYIDELNQNKDSIIEELKLLKTEINDRTVERDNLQNTINNDNSTLAQMIEDAKPKYNGVELQYSAAYNVSSSRLTKSAGVAYYNGHKETYYSQNVLPGSGLNIPGRHVADDGTIRDGDGYICVASDLSYLGRGATIMTSLGPGKVYDTGCAYGTIDIYVNW